jgi:spermidine synthase
MTRSAERVSVSGTVKWIMLVYFVSGMCSLIDEVIWVRLLKLTLGNTVYATTVVVSVFMGGLAVGALLMSRFADRIRDRLKWYAVLETVVTVSALCVPWLLRLSDVVYVWFFRTFAPTQAALLVVQVLLSSAIILVPSVTMGSTLPLLGRFVTGLERDSGRLVGRLYALNTLGAATGCLLAGFVLIRAFGVMGALYTAAALNLLVAAAGWYLGRSADHGTADEPVARKAAGPAVSTTNRSFYLLVAAFFLSGLASIGYEVAWVRSVMFLLGGDTYVFSSVLTVSLLGNVIGAAVGSKLAGRLTNPTTGFALTLLVLGVTGVLYFPVLVFWASSLVSPLDQATQWVSSVAPVASAMVKPLGQSLGLFLVPAFVMGVGFPIALQAWAGHVHRVGRSTGAAYGANTIGAVLGGIVTGFLLIPHLGMQRSISLLGLVLILFAAVLYLTSRPSPSRPRRLAFSALAIVLIGSSLAVPGDLLDVLIDESPWLKKSLETLSVREGVTTTVSVHRHSTKNTLHLYSSGQSIAGDTFGLRGDQKALGHFGALLNRDAKSVLSVGFGSGETTKCLSFHDLETIDCVEVAAEVVDSSLEYFQHLNLGDRVPEVVELIFMDAKNYLHLTDRRYDLIVNDSIHPRDFAENASLYGREYFESVRQRLEEGGLLVSWLPTYHMSTASFDSILGTMMDVFPHVTLWYLIQNPAPLVVLVASEDQQLYSPAHIEASFQKEAIRESLELIGILDGMDLLNCYIGDERDLQPRVGDFAVNSDFTPYIEFSTDKWTSLMEMYRRYVLEVRSETILDHLDLADLETVRASDWVRRFKARHEAADRLVEAHASTNELEHLRLFTDGLEISPGDAALLRARRKAESTLVRKGAHVLDTEGATRALGLADLMLAIHPESAAAWVIRSRVMQQRGDGERAIYAAQRAVALDPESEEAQENLNGLDTGAGIP